MKLLDFGILNGWPASTSTWKFNQEQLLQLQMLSLLGGTNFIITGCTDLGETIDNGWVVINGEILPFVGGTPTSYVVIVDTPTNRSFSGGASNPYYHDRIATFGTDTSAVLWSSFEVNDPNDGVLKRLRVAETLLATINTNLASKANSSDVLKKGGTVAFTPALATDPVNKAYVDAAVGAKCIYVGTLTNPTSSTPTITPSFNPLGLTIIAARSTSGNYTITHGIGSTNYFVLANGLREYGTSSAPYSASYVSLDDFLSLTFQAYTGTGSTPRTDEAFTFQIFTH